ncbi:hypothetical protein N0O92_07260 [Alkalihalobacillus sp. MEB130]|uniref:YphA family membrane protein n=1 Tax=Alkalihalobacillus sp. MEB130 TaxID=2976704 RepID=UPI0028DFFEB6|nr:hypothetical protein [Alkalihalobacillus sp. MEB130]MDT8860028.1 hypothetical protein [Alkalihalobacillus sp. MEB130]
MDGVFIYWFGWILWVIITFFCNKTKTRFWNALLLLLLFILLPRTLHISDTSIHVVYIIGTIYLFRLIAKEPSYNLGHSFVGAITIAAAYGGFQMMLIFDPVVEYMDSRWMTGLVVSVVSFFLTTTFKHRLLIALIGLSQGELLTGIVNQHHLYMDYSIGSFYFFDIVAIVCFLYSVVWTLSQLSAQLGKFVMREPKTNELKQSS